MIPGLFDAEWIWQARYDKKSPFSFDGYCNQAMHLVTTNEAIATEDQNFNFIFSDEDNRQTQWDQIYRTLPQLLLYAVEVCEHLMHLVRGRLSEGFCEALGRRVLAFCFCGLEAAVHDNDEVRASELRSAFREITGSCGDCEAEFALDDK